MTNKNTSEKINYEDEFYKAILRNAKSIFICKGCNKEFKQHARFNNHNVKNCNSLEQNKAKWKVHTSELLNRIVEIDIRSGVLKNPLNIFKNLLIKVGERASELNDPELNALMCRLTIYSIADPQDKDYNPELVKKILDGEIIK